MSILIKGMEMPKDCNTCQFHGFGGYKNEWIVCSLTGHSEQFLSHIRDCPLVEVPAPHGRLIDAGDAVITLKANKRENEAKGYILAADEDEIVRWIDKLPTIIEAEEGEDHEF